MHNCNDVEVYNSLVKKINEIINELNNLNLHKLESQRILNKCIELKNEFEKDSYLLSQTVQKNVDIIIQSAKLIDILNTELENSRITEEQEGVYFSLLNALNGYLRINKITGNTLWVDNDTGEVLTAFDDTKNLRLMSSFEDKLVTQEMVDSGKELAENLGKYKVDYKVTGKNKFDWNNIASNHIISVDNGVYEIDPTLNGNNNLFLKGVFKFKYNTQYAISYKVKNKTGSNFRVGIIYKDGSFENTTRNTSTDIFNEYTLITRTNKEIDYIRFDWSNVGTFLIKDFQIEEGSTATAYEPYKEQVKTYYLNSSLLEGDTIEDNGNDVVHVHRYNSVTFDGSNDEDWHLYTNKVYEDSTCINMKNPNKMKANGKDYATVMCDKLQYIDSGYLKNSTNISTYVSDIYDGNHIYIRVMNTQLSSSDIQGATQWLSENPITVVYELASPTYEVLDGNLSEVNNSYEKMSIEFNTDIPVTLNLTYTGTESTSSVSLLNDESLTTSSDYLGTDINDSIEVNNNEEEL